MFDTVFYAQLVRQSGLSHDYIAHRLNLKESRYLRKAAGIECFYTNEMQTLKDLFYLSDTEATELFFCNRFKAYCRDRGITNKQIADILGIKNASRLMNGKQAFKVSQVVKLCRHFNISADDYF